MWWLVLCRHAHDMAPLLFYQFILIASAICTSSCHLAKNEMSRYGTCLHKGRQNSLGSKFVLTWWPVAFQTFMFALLPVHFNSNVCKCMVSRAAQIFFGQKAETPLGTLERWVHSNFEPHLDIYLGGLHLDGAQNWSARTFWPKFPCGVCAFWPKIFGQA